jgi:hypothetical protein
MNFYLAKFQGREEFLLVKEMVLKSFLNATGLT